MPERERHVHAPLAEGKELKEAPLKKALRILLDEDIDSIRGTFLEDYVKPRIKGLGKTLVRKGKEFVADSLKDTIDIFVLGSPTKRNVIDNASFKIYTLDEPFDYTKCAQSPLTTDVQASPSKRVRPYVISYEKAIEVRTELQACTYRFDYATVADYYQLISAPTKQEDFDFGWKAPSLDNLKMTKAGDGYMLLLPNPEPIT